MATVKILTMSDEMSDGLGGMGDAIVLKATAAKAYDAITYGGALASATTNAELAGFIAPDTGNFVANYGDFVGGNDAYGEPNSVVRAITNGLAIVDSALAVDSVVRLAADGKLDTTGTGLIVGVVVRHPYNNGADTSNRMKLDIRMAQPDLVSAP